MTVEEARVVDAVGIESATGIVVLTISDNLEWDEANEHLLTLQSKINAYLAFIESGELQEQYPDATGRSVRIDVVCLHQPTEVARQFLSIAESTIREAGFAFGWRVFVS